MDNNIKTITLTSIIDAGSLNYDEGLSVISPLKKINTGKGIRVYMSPQAFKYSLYTTCQDLFKWRLSEVKSMGSGDKKVTQRVSSIIESEEVDLFGTMVTFSGGQGYKREAIVRVSPTISTCNYEGDKELLTNMGLSYRIEENPNMANIEHDRNLYKYSITIDYDRIGKDEFKIAFLKENKNTKIKEIQNFFGGEKKEDLENKINEVFKDLNNTENTLNFFFKCIKFKGFINFEESEFLELFLNKVKNIQMLKTFEITEKYITISFKIELTKEEINKRTNQILDGIYYLYRDIRGRRENLSPIFCIGTKGEKRLPIFANIVDVFYIDDKPTINTKQIEEFCQKECLEINKTYKLGGLENKFKNNFADSPKDVINFLKIGNENECSKDNN